MKKEKDIRKELDELQKRYKESIPKPTKYRSIKEIFESKRKKWLI